MNFLWVSGHLFPYDSSYSFSLISVLSFSYWIMFLIVYDEIMGQVMGAYGYSIEHILMVDIIPDPAVRKAMNEINAGNELIQTILLL